VAAFALIVAGISGYFFGFFTGLLVFFASLIFFSVLSAKNNSAIDDTVPSEEGATSIQFSPTDPSFEPISLSFTLGEVPQETTTASGGAYGIEEDKYHLDLSQAQCSCESWGKREQYSIGDPRRLCRHLVRALRERNLIQGNDEWSEAIIQNGEGIPLKAWRVRLDTAPDVLVTQGDSDEWLNVFAREKETRERISEASGPIRRHGWSVLENRWSFGQSVPGARELNRLLRGAAS
jgi:hypothetical protein